MRTDQTLVSVILCNYNYGRFIAEAIDSVLCQTHADLELIIVDDGSTDDSREVIASHKDSRIRAILHQENRGQAAAFNTGFAVAKGVITAFLDSDDWWKPQKLETIVNWHRFLQSDYAVLQHGLSVCDGRNVRPYKLILPVGDCFAEMQQSGRINFFVPTSGLSFRKAVLDRVFPIPTEFRVAADAYVMRAAFVFGNVYSIPDSLGFYRKHNNAVYENNDFNSDVFFSEILFPALASFYEANGINYQFGPNERVTGAARRWFFRFSRKWIPSPLRALLGRYTRTSK